MTNFRSGLMISASAVGMVLAAPALAVQPVTAGTQSPQDGSKLTPADANPQDIVVTAQKRTQLLIDVPQSVTVVSGRTLENQQANRFEDYLKLVPGLQLNQANPGQARVVLRGINTGGVASTVAVYLDETPFGSSTGLVNGAQLAGDFDTFDIARIEVLRGPQGTIYGASSLGGVIKFVSNIPQTDRLIARGRVGIEGVDGGGASYFGNAALNVPLSSTIAFRASGGYRKDAGFIDSIGNGGSLVRKNINGVKDYSGRASLLFKPSAEASLRLSSYIQKIKAEASSEVESDPVTLETLYGRPTRSQFIPGHSNITYRVHNATASYDLGPATLTSSTSYSTQKQSALTDSTIALSSLFGSLYSTLGQATNNKRFTQELRLSGHTDPLDFVVGGYYTSEKGLIFQHVGAFLTGTTTPAPGLGQPLDVTIASRYNEHAVFTNLSFHFGPQFDVDVGGRYSWNKQSATQTVVGALLGGATFASAPTRSQDDIFTYSVAPKFKIGRRASLYARVAKGFRPGGPNALPVPFNGGTPTSYQSDSLISYEAGVKAQSDDNRFSIDAAAFYIDWKNIQLFSKVAGLFGINANGGRARSEGFEFTATARPLTGLDLSVNGAYTKTRLRDDTNPITGGLRGDQLPYTPKYSAAVNADYRWPMSGTMQAFVGGSVRALSKQTADYSLAFRTTYGRQRQIPAYTVVDLRAGLDFGKVGVEAYVKNLTNADGKTSVTASSSPPRSTAPFGPTILTGVIRPRTIGLSLTASY